MRRILFTASILAACAIAGAASAGRSHHARLFNAADANNDGVVTRQEFDSGREALFARLDADHNGQLARADRAHHRHDRARRAGANHDGAISREEFLQQPAQMFERLDANDDGTLSAHERGHHRRHAWRVGHDLRRADSNRDRQISHAEFAAQGNTMFDRLDANDDGRVTQEEASAHRRHGQ